VPTHTAASLAWDCTTPPEPQQNNSNTWEFLLLHKNCPHLIPRPLALIKSINQPKNTTSRWHPQGNSSQSGAQSGYMSKHHRQNIEGKRMEENTYCTDSPAGIHCSLQQGINTGLYFFYLFLQVFPISSLLYLLFNNFSY
jgi:hypothetical protein